MHVVISPVNKVMDIVKSGDVNAVLTLLSTDELKLFHKKELEEVIDFEFKIGDNFENISEYIAKDDWKIVKMSDYLGKGYDVEKPTPELVSEAISFGKSKLDQGKRLLVHCQQGFSRSPAIAYLILCNYMDPMDAINETYRIRSTIMPNKIIVEIGDELMGLGGRAVQALQSRRHVQESIDNTFKYWF